MTRIFTSVIAMVCAMTLSATTWYAEIKRQSMPTYAQVGEPFSATFTITNSDATESITDIDVLYSPTGGTAMTVHHTMSQPIAPGTSAEETIDGFTCDVQGESVFGTYSIAKVNGETNYSSSYTYNYMLCANEIIPRNIVMEEITSTTCGFCPRGIIAMEYMRDTYTDGSWIGIAVHTNGTLYTAAYADFLKKAGTNTPNAIVNRDFGSNIAAYYLSMEDTYNTRHAYPSVVSVEAVAEPQTDEEMEAKTVTVQSSARFVFDRSTEYRFAYTVTEDNVGPYAQLNYYSGGDYGEMDGWENKSYYVSMLFNDIPRSGTIYAGVEDSLPAEITAGETYTTTQTLDVSDVSNLANAYVAVMVIDASTKEIANAVRIPLIPPSTGCRELSATDANSVAVSASAGAIHFSRATNAKVYNLSGRLVAAPLRATSVELPRGTYIVVAASQPAVKVTL